MSTNLEVLFTPAEFTKLRQRDLSDTMCVVFDVLRATTTMATALANGAEAILPVAEISDALAVFKPCPEVLLAGERDGLRITAAQTGSVDFDFGNSPREFTPERVCGRTIVMTTTNGTRALRACAGAKQVIAASFVNLEATARSVEANRPSRLLLVCAGTREEAAGEDALAAGALCERLDRGLRDVDAADSVFIARAYWRAAAANPIAALSATRNGRRLLAIPELAGDVAFCSHMDRFDIAVAMNPAVEVRRLP